MFNSSHAKHWSPFKIPPTPTIPSGNTDSYNLTCGAGADGDKNPSQFLEWKKTTTLPDGKDNDILKWSGDKWVVFSPSGSEENPKFLKYNGSELFWGPAALPDGTNEGDLLYWDPSAGDGGAWVVLTAPQNSEILIKKFDICENGQPKEYNMLVWDQE
jgi:hypothetical protein